MTKNRDHGGGLDAAVAQFGGTRDGWIDLSTGINPHAYPVGDIAHEAWTALPDRGAMERLERAARMFWNVPEGAAIVAAHGASAIISRLPVLRPKGQVCIQGPTYNEHAAAFDLHGWTVTEDRSVDVLVEVHPNNPDGRMSVAPTPDARSLTILDESFCDTCPDASHVGLTAQRGTIVLKSFGKFWGLAGVRLGFAIGHPETLGRLAEHLGPWSVTGPALEIGTRALADGGWADQTRQRLAKGALRLDRAMAAAGAVSVCGTDLFRTYEVADAARWQEALAEHHIWSRFFPYSKSWLRLGLHHPDDWKRVEAAIEAVGDAR